MQRTILEDWHTANPDFSASSEWAYPEGKGFNDFFKKGSGNLQKFPKLKHHKTGNKAQMCLHYQCKGQCGRGLKCSLAHLPKSRMTTEEAAQTSQAFQEAYAA